MELRSVTRWSSTWSPYLFVFCWSVSNVRWNSCQSSDTNCVPFLRRLCTSMAVSGKKQGSTHASAWSETVSTSTPWRRHRWCPAITVPRSLALWRKCGGVGRVAENAACIVSCYWKILVFDQYADESAKDHERRRRAGVGSTSFNLAMSSPLPSREAVMKNKHNKRGLSRLLCTFNMGCGVTVDSIDDGVFGHDEADITIISYMLQAADGGCHVVRVLSDDTDICIRVACLLDMALWSTGSSRRPDGEVGRCCPRWQCHMRQLGEHRLLKAAWSTCDHRLRHRVLPFRQG